jgi:hypothetical protein
MTSSLLANILQQVQRCVDLRQNMPCLPECGGTAFILFYTNIMTSSLLANILQQVQRCVDLRQNMPCLPECGGTAFIPS